ncbi:hypothetical protein [Vibrio vulnificus]|uniref:hypothetical protein n=1 Tax=Vibrio vulnificus TaxID=672 RepID=UPI002E7BDC8A|nr:hypothetical protein [Vibrio vulnificus]
MNIWFIRMDKDGWKDLDLDENSPYIYKLLKRDSQRVAFLLCVEFSDYGGMQRLRYCVAHPLAGRYATQEKGVSSGRNN